MNIANNKKCLRKLQTYPLKLVFILRCNSLVPSTYKEHAQSYEIHIIMPKLIIEQRESLKK